MTSETQKFTVSANVLLLFFFCRFVQFGHLKMFVFLAHLNIMLDLCSAQIAHTKQTLELTKRAFSPVHDYLTERGFPPDTGETFFCANSEKGPMKKKKKKKKKTRFDRGNRVSVRDFWLT